MDWFIVLKGYIIWKIVLKGCISLYIRRLYWRDASLNSLFEIYGLRIQLKRPGQQVLHDTITVQVFRKLKHHCIGGMHLLIH